MTHVSSSPNDQGGRLDGSPSFPKVGTKWWIAALGDEAPHPLGKGKFEQGKILAYNSLGTLSNIREKLQKSSARGIIISPNWTCARAGCRKTAAQTSTTSPLPLGSAQRQFTEGLVLTVRLIERNVSCFDLS